MKKKLKRSSKTWKWDWRIVLENPSGSKIFFWDSFGNRRLHIYWKKKEDDWFGNPSGSKIFWDSSGIGMNSFKMQWRKVETMLEKMKMRLENSFGKPSDSKKYFWDGFGNWWSHIYWKKKKMIGLELEWIVLNCNEEKVETKFKNMKMRLKNSFGKPLGL